MDLIAFYSGALREPHSHEILVTCGCEKFWLGYDVTVVRAYIHPSM